MTITYNLLLDRGFYRIAVNRFYKQRPVLRKFSVRFSLALILFLGMWAYARGRMQNGRRSWFGHLSFGRSCLFLDFSLRNGSPLQEQDWFQYGSDGTGSGKG
jgi:hypothetical protein